MTLRGKTGWREVEVGRGLQPDLPRCSPGELDPLRPDRQRSAVPAHLQGQQNDRRRAALRQACRSLVKQTALAAGVRSDLPEGERGSLFSGHSLRAGLASSAEIEERYVQKQLGHASAEMTRKYQRRRDRFRTNLTKASGL